MIFKVAKSEIVQMLKKWKHKKKCPFLKNLPTFVL